MGEQNEADRGCHGEPMLRIIKDLKNPVTCDNDEKQPSLRCHRPILRARAHSLVGNPVAIVGSRKISLAPVANRLGQRSNTVADDFVDRLAGRAEIEKVFARSEGLGEKRARRDCTSEHAGQGIMV